MQKQIRKKANTFHSTVLQKPEIDTDTHRFKRADSLLQLWRIKLTAKINSYHFFIWGWNLIHAVLYIEASIYKTFVRFLPENKDQTTTWLILDHLKKHFMSRTFMQTWKQDNTSEVNLIQSTSVPSFYCFLYCLFRFNGAEIPSSLLNIWQRDSSFFFCLNLVWDGN